MFQGKDLALALAPLYLPDHSRTSPDPDLQGTLNTNGSWIRKTSRVPRSKHAKTYPIRRDLAERVDPEVVHTLRVLGCSNRMIERLTGWGRNRVARCG